MSKITFSLKGTKFYISFGFLFVITLMFIFDETASALISLTAFAVHEISHIIFILLFKGRVDYIKFSLLELNISTKVYALSKWERIVVSLAGAFGNFLMALIFFSINTSVSLINIAVGCFQLLPIIGFDGDNVLEILGLSSVIRKIISFSIAFLFSLVGFYVLLHSTYNFSILALSLYMIFITLTCKDK